MKVAILDDYQHAFEHSAAINRLRQHAEVEIHTEKISGNALVQALSGCQVIISIRERTLFPAELLRALPDLELIVQTGSHAYHIDLDAATRAGILIGLAPGGTGAAELTFGLMISLMRRIAACDHALRQGQWPLVLGIVLKGKTLGILGLGKIGSEVARIGLAFGMTVVAWGPTLTKERAEKAQVSFLSLEEVLETADVVSVHLKLSDLSRGLLDKGRLRRMKKSSYLVNTARGAIINETALVEILQERAIAGAALDVFVEEPLPPNHPLLQLDNVVLTPHLGWPTDSGFEGFAQNATNVILNYMRRNVIGALNPQALEKRKAQR